MGESNPAPPISTFVVRLWQEPSAAGPRWRGHIEHVQSGESTAFLELDGMLSFPRCCGVVVGDRDQPPRKNG